MVRKVMAGNTRAGVDPLGDYRKKRDFSKTSEPAGAANRDNHGEQSHGLRYVMHKHAASHDHFDLRLQQDGVLRSWALPKGPSLEPGEKRLAVEVEDHPLEYGDFEGTIPEDQYGGGTVMLWDTGEWRCNGKQTQDHLDIELDAEKLKGAWTLVRTKGLGRSKSSADRKSTGKKSRDWLMIKRSDPHKPLKPHDRSVVSNRTMSQIARDRDKVWQRIRFADHAKGQGEEVHQQACQLGLEGVVSKKADSTYQTGRQKNWQKSKCTVHEEFIVGGYCATVGGRKGFASLLMGSYQDGKFIYMGRVGTGFDQGQIKQLHRQLQNYETPTKPFDSDVPAFPGIHWVKPQMVIEVEFTERTDKGYLRHPVFRGLREDKDAGEIVIDSKVKVAAIDSTDPATSVNDGKSMKSSHSSDEAIIEGVCLTHPDRVLYQQQGITKLDLALFYQSIEAWLLPWLIQRPLSLLRCPEGSDSSCFFQKHPRSNLLAGVPQVDIADKQGKKKPYCYVEDISHVIALVQAGVLEIHPWGCHINSVEKPDVMIFDLDPADDVPWKRVVDCARTLRDRLQQLELESFVKITGGKGIHVVVPLRPQSEWDLVKAFSHAVAEAHALDDPSHLTTNMNKGKRQGKIFIDYLRNGRGNTAIANYSTRARANAPLAVPLRWDELSPGVPPNHYRIDNLRRRLRALKRDPWHDFEQARRSLAFPK